MTADGDSAATGAGARGPCLSPSALLVPPPRSARASDCSEARAPGGRLSRASAGSAPSPGPTAPGRPGLGLPGVSWGLGCGPRGSCPHPRGPGGPPRATPLAPEPPCDAVEKGQRQPQCWGLATRLPGGCPDLDRPPTACPPWELGPQPHRPPRQLRQAPATRLTGACSGEEHGEAPAGDSGGAAQMEPETSLRAHAGRLPRLLPVPPEGTAPAGPGGSPTRPSRIGIPAPAARRRSRGSGQKGR